jgi:hypothetical protein
MACFERMDTDLNVFVVFISYGAYRDVYMIEAHVLNDTDKVVIKQARVE